MSWRNWIGRNRLTAACVSVVAVMSFGVTSGKPVPNVDAPLSLTSDAAKSAGMDVRAYVRARASRAGWTLREWRALAEIIHRESRWNVHADNPNSTAYGLFQILHMEPGTPLRKQVEQGIRYIRSRYGTPTAALAHWDKEGWY